MFNFFNKSDSKIREDVVSALKWDPRLSFAEVNVTIQDGVVTLDGSVAHYVEKLAAQQVAQGVGGVKAVADELEVKGVFDKSDTEIASSVVNALRWAYSVPQDIKVAVSEGWITLDGEAEWDFQRKAAQNAVSGLFGVRGVTNNISIRSKAQPSDIKSRIEEALKRSAESEGRKISVLVSGDRVTLSGNVHSYSEMEDARVAAWCAPGINIVENNLKIAP